MHDDRSIDSKETDERKKYHQQLKETSVDDRLRLLFKCELKKIKENSMAFELRDLYIDVCVCSRVRDILSSDSYVHR